MQDLNPPRAELDLQPVVERRVRGRVMDVPFLFEEEPILGEPLIGDSAPQESRTRAERARTRSIVSSYVLSSTF
jgi:hypothetical protein